MGKQRVPSLVSPEFAVALGGGSDGEEAAEYRSILEHRLRYLVTVDQPLVLIAQTLNIHTASTAFACALFFWCRLIYVAVYTAGIPVLRTLAFTGGFVGQVILALAIFGTM